MPGRINDDNIQCSFCGKGDHQVRKLIAGPNGVFICDECIDICNEIMDEELSRFTHEGGLEINLLYRSFHE